MSPQLRDALLKAAADTTPEGVPAPLFSFLSGSQTEGLAAAASDFDLYVVCDGPLKPIERSIKSPFGHVEVTWISYNFFDRIREAISVPYRPGLGLDLDWFSLHLAHRLLTGVVVDGPEAFGDLRAVITTEAVARYLAPPLRLEMQKALKDSVSRLSCDDSEGALVNARRAVVFGTDFALASAGNTNVNDKWRHVHLARLFGDAHPMVMRSRELLAHSPHPAHQRPVEQYVQGCAYFVQCLEDQWLANGLGLPGLFSFEPHRLWGPGFHPADRARNAVRKHPSVRSTLMSGRVALFDKAPIGSMSETAAVVWIAIDNDRDQSEVVDLVRQVVPAMEATQVTKSLAALSQLKVIY